MKRLPVYISLLFISLIIFSISTAQEKEELLSEKTFEGLKFRSIGPALMSGRISDIAIHPNDNSIWYVAVGSGGVWKTKNAGTTWKAIFDDQNSYSIGCVTIDQNNPHIIWVGTGENVGGRHVGYGDGIYKSKDDGSSWENMGLTESQHISKIIVHPNDSRIVWVASQGPLWNKGGERGIYKTSDGGTTWNKVLGDDEWTGATEIIIDPRNPNHLYAATWQRHRNVAAYMGGGPGSGIHESIDGGDTWQKLSEGLPSSNMGKIGLAISPQKPDVLYAAIELDRRKGGVFKSSDRGASWKKQSETVSGATGPHYYQELYASPHQFDRLYLVDVRMQISDNGGKTFQLMKEVNKHSDNHAIVFRADDPDYLLVGTDGGIYESFDLADNWRFTANLPLTQFYKVAVDDAEPFYTIYGGTQDNNTQGGPSRTDYAFGMQNSDWEIVLWGDGHQPATEPGNPDIIYAESQEGALTRVDRTNGEIVYIQPQPEINEDYERFNWDSPILVSPHSSTRIYFASQRVWKSDNRGNSWETISGDLSRNQERFELPIMGSTQGWDEPWDVYAMSTYNTITSLAESPLQEGLIYVGTDDGLIQVTEDGGINWNKIEVSSLPDVPKTAFVNDIKADMFDANTVYVVLDNHKFGDLNPYILKSTNRGSSWESIKGNLPDRTIVWRVVQDHIKPGLLFAATEFGIYFTINGGQKWIKLSSGIPTISFRDLAIQRRENDLVGASFGRGFYVLDDYSVLREVTEEKLQQEATLFSTRKAWWYIERFLDNIRSQGAAHFTAPNPPYGAVFTYYIGIDYKTKKEIRKEKEKQLKEEKKPITFPGWDELEAEHRQDSLIIWLTVKDTYGNIIRRMDAPTKKGFHRVAWDLRSAAEEALEIDNLKRFGNFVGPRVAPGKFSVTLSKQIDGIVTELTGPVEFEVEQLRKGALDGAEPEEVAKFWREVAELNRIISLTTPRLKNAIKKADAIKASITYLLSVPGTIETDIHEIKQALLKLDTEWNGPPAKKEPIEKYNPTIMDRYNLVYYGTSYSTYGPTPLIQRNLDIAHEQLKDFNIRLNEIVNTQLPNIEKALIDAGGPVLIE